MTFFLNSLLLAATVAGATTVAGAEPSADTPVRAVLAEYGKALNASDADTILALYADDGVFMPQHSLPSIGKTAVRQAYYGVFQAIKLDIRFEVDEVRQIGPRWAFARTRSEGTVTIQANGAKLSEANQELFLFELSDKGEWKIARYIFSTTNPPRG